MAITDVEEAVAAVLDSDSACTSLGLSGSSGREKKKTPYPYYELSSPLDARTSRNTDSIYKWRQIQIEVYGQSKQSVSDCADAIISALDDEVDLSRYVAGLDVLDHQFGSSLYRQDQDAVWCYLVLFNVKYRTVRRQAPAS